MFCLGIELQDALDKYGVVVIGRTWEITERYYLISAERRIKHPAASAITEAARLMPKPGLETGTPKVRQPFRTQLA